MESAAPPPPSPPRPTPCPARTIPSLLLHRPHTPLAPCKAHSQPPLPETFSSPHRGFSLTPWMYGYQRSVHPAGCGPRLPAHGFGARSAPRPAPRSRLTALAGSHCSTHWPAYDTNSELNFHCRSENTKSGPHRPRLKLHSRPNGRRDAQQRPQLKHILMLAAGTQQLATCCAKKEPSHVADGPFQLRHTPPETRLCTAQWAWVWFCVCV